MKILHVLSSNKFSGAENVVCQIVEMFRNVKKIEMIYCSPNGEIANVLKQNNVDYIPVSKMNVKSLKKVISDVKPDIIHSHDMKASFISALSCGKIKLISHIHNNAIDSRKLSLKSILYYYAASKASKIIWVSKSAYNGYYFNKSFDKKSIVLYNVIDVNNLYDKMQNDTTSYDFDIIYLGRLTYPKNPYRLIKVLSLVKKEKNDIKVAIVGTGDLEKETKKMVVDYGLSENVSFLGFQKNPLKMLWDSKVMIMTSLWEGTPMCALEAVSLDVPIVSTPTDGLLEIVTNESIGYLSDDDSILSQRCLEIITNHKDKQIKVSKENNVVKNRKIIDDYKQVLLNIYEEGLKNE